MKQEIETISINGIETISINGKEYVPKESIQSKKIVKDYCIVRTYSAGVFAGNIVSRNGQEVVMENARRLWYWDGAASLSQLAMSGTSKPQNCKFPEEMSEVALTQVIEIIPCSQQAILSIKGVSIWKA